MKSREVGLIEEVALGNFARSRSFKDFCHHSSPHQICSSSPHFLFIPLSPFLQCKLQNTALQFALARARRTTRLPVAQRSRGAGRTAIARSEISTRSFARSFEGTTGTSGSPGTRRAWEVSIRR